jgi:hypothetical protein
MAEKTERTKSDARDMARELLLKRRISTAMAFWALRQSGHTRGEIERWIREIHAADNNCSDVVRSPLERRTH